MGFGAVVRVLCMAGCLAVASGPAKAETYFVAEGGDDFGPGSEEAPFGTIQRAADEVSAGDTIVVRAGTYAGALISRSGVEGAPIVLRGEPGAIVARPGPENENGDAIWIRNASYVVVEGLEVRGAPRSGIAVQGEPDRPSWDVVVRGNVVRGSAKWGIFTGYAHAVVVEENEVSFSGEHGISISNSGDSPIVRRNRAHHNRESGIQLNTEGGLPGDGVISNAVVEANLVFENGEVGGAGINFASVTSSLVANNLVYDNHATGIALSHDGRSSQFGSMNNRLFNNTVVQAPDGRYALSIKNGSIENTVLNNILFHPGERGSIEIDSSSLPGLRSDFNAMTARLSVDRESMSRDQWRRRAVQDLNSIDAKRKLFVSYKHRDLALRPGSAAIDAGTLDVGLSADLLGAPRPQGRGYDLGAIESAGP